MYFNAEIILLWLIIFIMIVYLFNTWFMYQNRDLLLLVSFALAIILVISNDPSIYIKEHSQHFVLNNYFIFGTNILLVKKFILVLMLAFIVMLSNYNKIQSFPLFEYLILIMIGLFSICIIIHGNHLFVIFIFIELLNLCIYCLLGINRDSNKGIESAFKYFIQSAFATIIGFFGISLIYFTTGTLFLNELSILIINKDLN
jgi:NADH:ubiquinone oxidoreductase subunit 2 (subunit N)